MSWTQPSDRTPADGEAWTREVLEELRTARFSPLAWARLIVRSAVRARAQERRHRRAHRQVIALAAAGGLAWLITAALGAPWPALAGLAWWLALMLMVDWHLGMLERPDGSTLPGLGAANAVTVVRGGIVPLLPVLDRTGLLVAFAVFGALDVLDGPLARLRGEQTRLGAWLDGSLDGIATAVAVVAALRLSAVPVWLVVLVLVRHALPWAAAAVSYLLLAARPPAHRLVTARIPGLVLAVGLGLALLDHPAGLALATIGAGTSLSTAVASIVRAGRRPQAAPG